MRQRWVRMVRPLVERFPTLAATYRHARDERALYGRHVPTPLGFQFYGNPGMQDGTFEVEETALLRDLIVQHDVLINIGANIGYYCCLALGLGRRVVAFEPVAHNVQLLLRNIKANRWEERIEVFPVALGSRPGMIDLYGSGTMASTVRGWAGVSERFVTLVPALTLDQALGSRYADNRCLILIDVEGAEYGLLNGALSYLERVPRPTWFIEIQTRQHQPAGVAVNPHLQATFELFFDHGYEAFTGNTERRSVRLPEIQAIAAGGADTLGTHNFLFRARADQDA